MKALGVCDGVGVDHYVFDEGGGGVAHYVHDVVDRRDAHYVHDVVDGGVVHVCLKIYLDTF